MADFNLRTVLLIASCLTVSPVYAQAPATPEPASEMPVYDTALAPGWQNWSWATADLSVELNGSPRKPIRVVAGPWQALYLHHDPFSTMGLTRLSMLIQGSAPDGDVRIFALIDGIWVQNATAGDLPKFYVTEIKIH